MTFEQCRYGMAAGPHPKTAEAGLEILKEGGSAFDAAVAAAFTEGVVQPAHNGVAGYGGAFVAFDARAGQVVCVDYNTEAPAAARPDMFATEPGAASVFTVVDALHKRGPLSIGIPGVVAGLDRLHRGWGTLPLDRLLAPAVRAAREGWRCNRATRKNLLENLEALRAYPDTLRLLLNAEGAVPEQGDRMRNPELGETLEHLGRVGLRDFYEGKLAGRIADSVREQGGIVTREDLAQYQAREVPALSLGYRGVTLHTPPVGCGGVTSFQVLQVLEDFALPHPDGPEFFHLYAEALKACWRRRVTEVGEGAPEERQLDPALIEAIRAEVRKHADRASQPEPVAPDPFFCTSHICTADAAGNVVSLTQTHGASFGSYVSVPGTGLIFGHGMARFEPRPGWPNSIAPGKRPLHNMAPMLATRQGRPVAAYGTPGGRTIVNNQALFTLALFRWGRGIDEALALPRLHAEEAEPLKLERSVPEETVRRLEAMGHRIERVDYNGGPAHGILLGASPGELAGATDPRWEGKVAWE